MSSKMDIKQIADLARLNLRPEEKDKLAGDLESILAYVDQLQEVDVTSVEPTSHVLPIENVFRKDEARPSGVRDRVLEHAPKREGSFFKVPKVIEEL